MARDDSPKPPPRRIDKAAKLRFLKGVRAGQSRDDAAAGTGFCWRAFYQIRRRDPLYEFAWLAAMELSARDEADARRAAETLAELQEDGTIEGQNRRLLQLKPNRGYRFDERRKQIFLDHFAGTADEHAAAEAAGVSYVTVRSHVRRDPGFAALRDEALGMAYAVLEAEAVRQRLEAQRRLRDNLDPKGDPSPAGAGAGSGQGVAEEFERVMKLLARYDRRDGRIATREHAPAPSRAFSFEDAIVTLDKALDSLGFRRTPLPPREGDAGQAKGGPETDGSESGGPE